MSERLLSEFELIHRFFTGRDRGPGIALGVGDDCSLLAPRRGQELAVSVDTMVCGTHFFEDQPAAAVGHKALAAALSDLAAMGAEPLGALLALTLPRVDTDWLQEFAAGWGALAEQLRVPLIGGDTTRGPLAISVTVLGQVPAGAALRRTGAQPGNLVVVSGSLGGAFAGLQLEQQRRAARREPPAVEDSRCKRFFRPEPRLALGRTLRGRTRTAIDLSDGLLADLGHVCTASGCGARLSADDLPRDPLLADWPSGPSLAAALSGGDDYELLFAWPARQRGELRPLAAALQLPLTVIGEFVEGGGIQVLDASGTPIPLAQRGFDHFRPD
ncbi:Thiamine-monophosphate kinase [Thioalkalivibrio nitratireducens DSM 14787]|uniref:Thiamine-monophosphate kinase n=1 Tax=Thioalkalivibrio nitratireducens (strain DSM 14787 / UNIQEM 213 / ALEN2) TaxID=1255043 RepID=L0DUJ7_THIND|nr:thiamine-phosphate kinase [Thioalkalivibrio nitratireducens]AGA32677.1 Thiamine-monophosphate kinase [Thioalkalivibrio nitratireducens DSM 14787]